MASSRGRIASRVILAGTDASDRAILGDTPFAGEVCEKDAMFGGVGRDGGPCGAEDDDDGGAIGRDGGCCCTTGWL